MPSRPLRTSAARSPKNQGERIRVARIESNLSQAQLASAISKISGGRVTKSLVSQWETGDVKNPNNANMLAIQVITGFSMNWLVTGRGPQRVTLPSARTDTIAPLDQGRLARAIAAAVPDLPDTHRIARAVGGLYDLLGDTPDIKDDLLARFAAALLKAD